MSYIPRSSLIPQEASGVIPLQMKKRRTIHIFSTLALVLFFGSILSSGGLFLYNDFLQKELDSAKNELSMVSNVDNEEKINELQMYDEKLNVGNTLLDNHLAISTIFSKIEALTKETVQFDDFEFTYDPGFDATLKLTGNTEEFSSVALQKIQFLEDELFSDFVVKGITSSNESVNAEPEAEALDELKKGKVGFSIDGRLKKGLLNYTGEFLAKKSIQKAETGTSTSSVSVPVTSTSGTTTLPQSATSTATSTKLKETP